MSILETDWEEGEKEEGREREEGGREGGREGEREEVIITTIISMV